MECNTQIIRIKYKEIVAWIWSFGESYCIKSEGPVSGKWTYTSYNSKLPWTQADDIETVQLGNIFSFVLFWMFNVVPPVPQGQASNLDFPTG